MRSIASTAPRVERIAYEVLWIHAGDFWGIDVDDSVARIAKP